MNVIKPKIVVAQTDSVITDRYGDLLKSQGYSLNVVNWENHIIKGLKDGGQPELYLLDSRIDEPDVIKVIEALKSDEELNPVPVLVLDFSEEDLNLAALINAGCDDIIRDPVDPAILLIRVRALIKVRSLMSHMDDANNVISTLARAIEAKDRYTMGHADRVAHFAVDLGMALGVTGYELDVLRKGGMLHDLGKIAIPDAILLKPGKYTPEEFAIMKRHPVLGCDICSNLRSLKDAVPLIRHHHERLDGSGYPDGLKGNQISPLIRIISAVDIYDALRSKRVYKAAFDLEKTMRIMWEEANKGWWDKDVIAALEEGVRMKTIGYRVSAA